MRDVQRYRRGVVVELLGKTHLVSGLNGSLYEASSRLPRFHRQDGHALSAVGEQYRFDFDYDRDENDGKGL